MQPDNFELTAQFKIEGGNSGIQYRSKVIDEDKFVVSGYQADIDFTNKFAGILYEEKGRGILAKRGEKVTIDEAGEKADLTIRRRSGHLPPAFIQASGTTFESSPMATICNTSSMKR